MFIFELVMVALFGLIFGSFGTVLLTRVAAGESISKARSHCRTCGYQIRAFENIPVLSFIFLRGRCSNCKSQIPLRYVLVEIGTGALFVLVYVTSGLTLGSLAMAGFAIVTLPLLFIDVDEKRLPNPLTLTPALFALLLVGAQSWAQGSVIFAIQAILVASVAPIALTILNIATKGGMGMGDVKLSLAIGLCLVFQGWQAVAAAFVVSFASGGIVALVLLLSGKSRKFALPFGPYLLVGAWFSFAAGSALQWLLIWPWVH